MIPLIDLTPESCREGLRRRRRLQLWISSYIVTCAVLIAVIAVLSLTTQRAQQRVDYLLQQVQLDADQQRQARALGAEISHYESLIARHDRLAWPIRIGDIIRSVGQVAPDTITLTAISVTPRATGDRRSRRSGGAGAAYDVMYVEIAGIAPDDLDVASFVAGLQSHALFSTITVDYARKAQIGHASAREFGVTCEIDLDAVYEIHPDGEAS